VEVLEFSARLAATADWCRLLSRPGMPFEPEGRGFNSSRAHHVPRRSRLFAPGKRWLEQALHRDDVHPAAVELSLFAVDANRVEAVLGVQGHAGGVGGKGR
jgi:hypothetical protein